MGWLVKIYNDLKNDFPLFFYLYHRVKKEGLDKQDIMILVKNQQRLKDFDNRVQLYGDFIQSQQLQKQQLEQDIDRLEDEISKLNNLHYK